ncbi:MAG: hypothetical protein QXP36_08060, partial [Conexivisphaerales archaeon]
IDDHFVVNTIAILLDFNKKKYGLLITPSSVIVDIVEGEETIEDLKQIGYILFYNMQKVYDMPYDVELGYDIAEAKSRPVTLTDSILKKLGKIDEYYIITSSNIGGIDVRTTYGGANGMAISVNSIFGPVMFDTFWDVTQKVYTSLIKK